MSSILTNNGAMVALKTLKSINSNLLQTQSEIATGKRVSDAKDNASVWAISKTMESDVKGFSTISESLSLGQATVTVARQASESITDLLTQIKGKIVAAQEGNVDKAKIQTDISELRNQVNTVVNAAQFNGLNLLDGSTGSMSVLASLDRDSSGNVSTSTISITGKNMSASGYSAKAVFTGSDGASTAADTFAAAVDDAASTDIVFDNTDALAAGDSVSIRIGDKTASYTISAEDVASTTIADVVAVKMKSAIENLGITGLTVDYDSGTVGTLSVTNGTGEDVSISGTFKNAGSGDLGALGNINVVSDASGALTAVEGLIKTAIDATAAFGSSQARLETQSTFVKNLSDSMKAGIGAMVDADMEEASARLQALQVQQQLGVQALSIANQAPQSILSLFR